MTSGPLIGQERYATSAAMYYPLMAGKGTPAIILYVDDLILASQLMIKKGFTIIGESDLAGGEPD